MSNATRHSTQSIPLAQLPKPFNMRTSEACLSCINCLIWELVRHGWAWLHQSCRLNCLNRRLKLAISQSGSINMSNSAEPLQSDQILAWEPDHMLLVCIVSPIDKHNHHYILRVMASSLKSKGKGGSKTASKLGKSSQPVSWRRKYKSILREKVDDWANTSSLEEERAVIGRIPAVWKKKELWLMLQWRLLRLS